MIFTKNTSRPNFLSKINYFRYVTVKLDQLVTQFSRLCEQVRQSLARHSPFGKVSFLTMYFSPTADHGQMGLKFFSTKSDF